MKTAAQFVLSRPSSHLADWISPQYEQSTRNEDELRLLLGLRCSSLFFIILLTRRKDRLSAHFMHLVANKFKICQRSAQCLM